MQICFNRFPVYPLPFPLFLDGFMDLFWYWCDLASVTGKSCPARAVHRTESNEVVNIRIPVHNHKAAVGGAFQVLGSRVCMLNQ